MKNLKKYINLIIFILIVTISSSTFASEIITSQNNAEYKIEQTDINSLQLYSDSIYMIEQNTGDVIYEKNAYQKMYPASTTKMLTAILVIEKCDLNEIAEVSSMAIKAVPPTYSVANLQIRWKI